jgi:F-type H+-transporting ATPase subunit epsilon
VTLHVELVSPERIIYSGEADQVVARTTDGEIAFLTGHAPFIGALGIAQVVVTTTEGDRVRAAVHGGFVEVSHDRVTVLSDVAELADDIDRARAEAALRRAEEALRSGDEEAEDAVRRAQVRLDLAS